MIQIHFFQRNIDQFFDALFGILFRGESGHDLHGGYGGLVAVASESLVVDSEGVAHPLLRGHAPPGSATLSALPDAMGKAVEYIVDAQAEDGRFRYQLNPFSGRESFRGFGI